MPLICCQWSAHNVDVNDHVDDCGHQEEQRCVDTGTACRISVLTPEVMDGFAGAEHSDPDYDGISERQENAETDCDTSSILAVEDRSSAACDEYSNVAV